MNVNAQLFNQIADSLVMDVTFNRNTYEITGEKHRVFKAGPLSLPYTAKIWYSVCDRASSQDVQIAHVMVHVMGDLWVSLLADNRDKAVTLFLVDSTRLAVPLLHSPAERKTRESLYDRGEYWSRKKLYEALAPGVVGVYTRDFLLNEWKQEGVGNSLVIEYVAVRKAGANASDARRSVPI